MAKRKSAKGNKKGRPFEILVAKTLSLWWTDSEDDWIFAHSHTSGAMATSAAKRGKSRAGHHGDIAYVNAIGKPFVDLICTEVKKGYNKSTIVDFIDGPKFNHEYSKWVTKVRRDMKATGAKYWWIIHRRDTKGILLTFPQKFLSSLLDCERFRKTFGRSFVPTIMTTAKTKNRKCVRLMTVPLIELLNVVTPQDIKEMT